MQTDLTLRAHAKVNLCLSVAYPPVAGYHQLRSVFQELDLHDILCVSVAAGVSDDSIRTAAGTCVELRCEVEGIEPRDNLIFRALDEAEAAFVHPIIEPEDTLVIEVEKHIPAGGGLGGGSSDAAAMLKAYARFVGIDIHDDRLLEVARRLGADVAFFLHGGAALMGGRGDVFERSLPPLKAPFVLMGGFEGNSTADVYRIFDEDPQPELDADALAETLEEKPQDLERIAMLCGNNLDPAACHIDPMIKKRLEAAREHPGVLAALVSGSGATSFAICESDDAAEQLAQDIAGLCGWVHVCRV